jgi:hypothetical protein
MTARQNDVVGLVEDAEDQVALAANQVTLASNQVTLAANQVTLASNQVALAEDQVTLAESAAAAASASANASIWVSGQTYEIGVVRFSPINFLSYRRKTAGAGTTDPSLDATNWAQVAGTGDVLGPSSATNNNLAAFDGISGKLIKQAATVSIAQGGTGATTAETARTAVGAGDVTLTGTQTLTNKTIAFGSNTLSGVQASLVSGTNIKTVNGNSLLGSGNLALGDVTLAGTQTLTNKTIAFDSNTLTNVASTNTTQTLTNKTLTSPVITQNVQVISTNTTAVRSRVYVMTASLTLTLPASPTAGDTVMFANRSGTSTPVIARNGQNIMGIAEDMTLDNVNHFGVLVYADATRGWIFN